MSNAINVPVGRLSGDSDEDEDAAAAQRRAFSAFAAAAREALQSNRPVRFDPQGNIVTRESQDSSVPTIIMPPGKLAAFHWYQRDPELLEGEKEAMRKYFPQFKLTKLSDGRLSWLGYLNVGVTGPPKLWFIQLVYDNNHPSNTTFGGSIKAYLVDPNLEKLQSIVGRSIPHTLKDYRGGLYLCTARAEDFKAGYAYTYTSASALSWVAKWINYFELCHAGYIPWSEFAADV